jgi:hypothetical protein
MSLCDGALKSVMARLAKPVHLAPVMKVASTVLFLIVVGIGTTSVTRNASALPLEGEVAVRMGAAPAPFNHDSPNSNGVGAGVRAGASLSLAYGGLSLMHYLGETENYPRVGPIAAKSLLYGIEIGCNIGNSLITLRPQLGVGAYTFIENATPASSDWKTITYQYLEPGGTVLVSFGRWIVGADASVLFAPAIYDSSGVFTAHAQAGIKL